MRRIPEPRSVALTICFVVLFSFGCLARAGAATLPDYAHRVSGAIATIEQLKDAHDEGDAAQREHFIISSVARIREDLPVKETVVLNTQSIVVDNAWLHEALKHFENADRTSAQRAAVLERIEERLRALDEQLKELQRANPSVTDKDGDKGRLAEILRRSDFNKPVNSEDSALGRLWERFLRWFLSLFRMSKPLPRGPSPFLASLLQVLLLVSCLVAIAFLIWKLVPRYFKGRGKKKQKREARIVLGERLEPDQTAADLLAQAETLARNGDLRAAIRKAYIALLCELGDRKIVSLAQHKTNRDYLNSVRERTRLYGSMQQLTRSFELHWYGFQPADQSDWAEFRSGYQQALKAVPAG